MSAMRYIVNKIMQDINPRLLDQALRKNDQWSLYDNKNLESLIEDKVLRRYVIPDLDVTTGEYVVIPLHDLPYRTVDNVQVFDIPLSRTQGRHINVIHALETDYADLGGGHDPMTNRAANAAVGIHSTGTARAKLVPGAPNVVVVYEYTLGTNIFLRCELDNDENFNNMSSRIWGDLAELSILAAKHIIYTQLYTSAADSDASGGAPSENTISMIESYSDAKELYNEQLKMIPKKMMMTDKPRHNRIIKYSLGGLF